MQALKDKKFMGTVRVEEKISDLSRTEKFSLIKSFSAAFSSLLNRIKTSEVEDSELERYNRKVLAQRSASETSARMFMMVR